MMPEPLTTSEEELLVFISSRQDNEDEEMLKARALAIKAVKDHDGVRVWAFEDVPASSEKARDRYLTNAGKASFMIWLIGSSTTEAVVNEIEACMQAGGKLLAFKLPANERDHKTMQLIERVSTYATWKEVETVERLPDHIRTALTDEIIRGFKDPAPRNHDQFLRQKKRESIADTKRLWATLGVPEDIAKELAEDRSVGHKLEPPKYGVLMIMAIQGSGKTLAAHRLYQHALDSRNEDHFKPFPIYLRARSMTRDLKDHVEEEMSNQGTPYNQTILLIIDGLDEVGQHNANRILDEAASYTDANHSAAVVALMRPLPGLKSIGKTAVLPECTEDEFISITSITAGQPVTDNNIPYRIFKTKLPLLAVILGIHLRNRGPLHGTTLTQMIELLIHRILQESEGHPERTENALKKLATAATDSGESVHKSEIDPSYTVQRMIGDSRIIIEQDDKLDFALAIFREWFAAKALLEKTVTPEEVALASSRWVVPIAIAVNSGTTKFAHELIKAIVTRNPRLAGSVLNEVKDNWSTPDTTSDLLPGTAIDLGHNIRDAMNDWKEGLGPLMNAIGPVNVDGNVTTLGISKEAQRVTTTWYRGNEQLSQVVEIPENWDPFAYEETINWDGWRNTLIEPNKLWAWTFAHESLFEELERNLKNLGFALESDIGIHELTVQFGREKDRYGLTGREISSNDELIKWIDQWRIKSRGDRRATTSFGAHKYTYEDLEKIKTKLSESPEKIGDPIEELWPSEDKGWVEGESKGYWFEFYSNEQLLKRTSAIFSGALHIYNDIAKRWFTDFSKPNQMPLMMPLRLEGILGFAENHDAPVPTPPRLVWWPKLINKEDESGTFFEIASWEEAYSKKTMERRKLAQEEFAEQNRGFHQPVHRLFSDNSRPATRLAHQWLTTEAMGTHWL